MSCAADVCLVESGTLASRPSAGYDYEFDPPLDPKYECPICLMCQRDCVQTSCGHKFCGQCILSWLSNEREQCPQDNCTLCEDDIYPDNYTRREILQLNVKCPNSKTGCPESMVVASVDEHLDTCQFQIVACPNRCSRRTVRGQLEEHCASTCLRRSVSCSLCGAQFLLHQQNAHLTTCPLMMVSCDACQYVVQRQELSSHLAEECPRTEVTCHFAEVGCKVRMQRGDLSQHLRENTQLHMKLLALAFKYVSGSVSDLSRAVVSIPTADSVPVSMVPHLTPPGRSSDTAQVSSTSADTDKASAAGNGATCSPGITFSPSPSIVNHHRSVSAPSDGDRGLPCGASAELGSRLQMDLSRLDLARKTMDPEHVIKVLCEKNVLLEQRSREQAIQIENLRETVRELSESASVLRQQVCSDMLARCCHGVFLWRMTTFSTHLREMEENVSKGVHSPSFYTSPFGYRMCMRASLRTSGNERFLAVFIHMRRGDNDDILQWPFTGRFSITMIDQCEGNVRRDFTEVMSTRPGLEAFERPHDDRNIKGWGFAQFVPLVRVRSQFVRRDTLLLQCTVQPTDGTSIIAGSGSTSQLQQ